MSREGDFAVEFPDEATIVSKSFQVDTQDRRQWDEFQSLQDKKTKQKIYKLTQSHALFRVLISNLVARYRSNVLIIGIAITG